MSEKDGGRETLRKILIPKPWRDRERERERENREKRETESERETEGLRDEGSSAPASPGSGNENAVPSLLTKCIATLSLLPHLTKARAD